MNAYIRVNGKKGTIFDGQKHIVLPLFYYTGGYFEAKRYRCYVAHVIGMFDN